MIGACVRAWVHRHSGWMVLVAFGAGCFGLGCCVMVLQMRSDCAVTLAASSEGYRAALGAKDQLILRLGTTATGAVEQAATAVGQVADAAEKAADAAEKAATDADQQTKEDAARDKVLRRMK